MELLALRSTSLADAIGNYTIRSGNEFYTNDEFRVPLQDFVNDMKVLVDKNNFLEKTFGDLQLSVLKVSNISHFFDDVGEIDAIVADLNSLVEVKDVVGLITEVGKVSRILKSNDFKVIGKIVG